MYNFTYAGFLGDQKKRKAVQRIDKEPNIVQLISSRRFSHLCTFPCLLCTGYNVCFQIFSQMLVLETNRNTLHQIPNGIGINQIWIYSQMYQIMKIPLNCIIITWTQMVPWCVLLMQLTISNLLTVYVLLDSLSLSL